MKNYIQLFNYFIDLYSITSIELVWKYKIATSYVEYEGTYYYKLGSNFLPEKIIVDSPEYKIWEQTLYLQIKTGSVIIAEIEQASLLNDSQYDTDKIITIRQHAAETIAKKKAEDIMQLKHEYIKSLKD